MPPLFDCATSVAVWAFADVPNRVARRAHNVKNVARMRLRVIMFCVFVYNEKAVSIAFGGRGTHEMPAVERVV